MVVWKPMTKASDLLPDDDVTADRKPTNCPFCGHDGVFDAGAKTHDTITYLHKGSKDKFTTSWREIHCPNCDGRFRMIEQAWRDDDE